MGHRSVLQALCASTAIVAMAAPSGAYAQSQAEFNLPAQDLGKSLRSVGQKTNTNIAFDPADTKGKTAPELKGSYSALQAVERLLAGSGLAARNTGTGSLVVSAVGNALAVTADGQTAAPSGEDAVPAGQEGISEILVVGSRSQNVDIRRTEDDPQPYVVFNKEEIERSDATNLEEFFRSRLPMNTVQRTHAQTPDDPAGSQSSINLRGLGTNQTLILVNGRRLPSVSIGTDFRQADINGIPLAAIERIEILPTTAAAIYGGGATGGVINIILRHDYRGITVAANYGNTYDWKAARRRFDISGGLNLLDGRLRATVSASHSEADPLLVGDRNFARRGREMLMKNRPGDILDSFFPILGYTPNIRSADGANLVLKDGSTPLNSQITFIPVGYPGTTTDNGAALLNNAGKYNILLSDDLLGNRQSILSDPTTDSVIASVQGDLTGRLSLFVDAALTVNRGVSQYAAVPSTIFVGSDAPNNPFENPIFVSFASPNLEFQNKTKSDTLIATGGAIWRLPKNWTTSVDYSWSRSRSRNSSDRNSAITSEGISALSNGTLDILRDTNIHPLDFSPYLFEQSDIAGPFDTVLRDATFRLAGPVLQLPGGKLTLSGFAERRKETASHSLVQSNNPDDPTQPFTFFQPGRSQKVASYYLEAVVPIFSELRAVDGIQSLEFQTSVRHDEYRTRSPVLSAIFLPSPDSPPPSDLEYRTNKVRSTDYLLGVKYSPIQSLAFRASYGTGFLPPSIAQIVERRSRPRPITVRDPKRGNVEAQTGPVVLISGGNSELEPEQSKSLSFGAIFAPARIGGLRVSLDYTQVDKSDEIASIGNQGILDLEDELPGRVIRDPLEPGAPPGYTAGPIVSIDSSLLNIARTRVKAWDFQVDYTWDSRFLGRFSVFLIGTRQSVFARKTLDEGALINTVGFSDGPLKFRANGGLNWEKGPWAAAWTTYYYNSYRVYSSDSDEDLRDILEDAFGRRRNPSQVFHDLFLKYRIDNNSGKLGAVLSNMELSLAIHNLFNKSPTIIPTSSVGGYDTYGDPRLRSYSLTLRKSF